MTEFVISLAVSAVVVSLIMFVLVLCTGADHTRRGGKTKNEIRDEAYRNGRGWKH